MTPDLQREFQLLAESARRQLKDAPKWASYRHVFSFWAFPSFAPAYRWTLYSPLRSAERQQPFASLKIWRRDLDLEKFRSPVERLKYAKDLAPTIEPDEQLWLRAAEATEIEQRIQGIPIPIFVESKIFGCDGTGFEFCCGDAFGRASIHWWESFPIEWRPFTGAVIGIVEELERKRKTAVRAPGVNG